MKSESTYHKSDCKQLRIGIVGCGQIFQTLHLPSLRCQKNVEVAWVVDTNPNNLKKVQKFYPKAKQGRTIEEMDCVDAVMIATPNYFHYQQAKLALEKGWHVFVEKPLTIDFKQSEELVKTAGEKKLILSVNLNRRYFSNIIQLKELIASKEFGDLIRIRIIDGSRCIGAADSQVSYQSSLKLSGGGVLLDTGSHMIDLALYLISAISSEVIDYADDGFSGLEAECRFCFKAGTNSKLIEVDGFLSRLSLSPQKVIVYFDHAVVTASLNPMSCLEVRDLNYARLTFLIPAKVNSVEDSFKRSLYDFLTGCRWRGYQPINSASHSLLSLKTIDECYSKKKVLPNPWNETLDPKVFLGKNSKSKKRIVGIIGAGGFLGSRLFERLMRNGAYSPKAITHSSSGSFSILRYTDAIEIGDASNEQFLKKALEGCDIIVNCAINTRGPRSFAIKATKDIAKKSAKVAAQIGAKRFIQISTIAVHGIFSGRKEDKLTLDPTKSTYAMAKYLSEHEVLKVCVQTGLEAVILRMGHIYGPYSLGWSVEQKNRVRTGELIQVENWRNPSNTVFVDNAVDAICAALDRPRINGEIFYITDWPNKTWQEFYDPLFQAENKRIENIPNIDFDDFMESFKANHTNTFYQTLDLWREWISPCLSKNHLKSIKAKRKYQKIFDLMESILPYSFFKNIKTFIQNKSLQCDKNNILTDPIFDLACCYASSIELPIEKSLEKLGYCPSVSQARAAEITIQWLKSIE